MAVTLSPYERAVAAIEAVSWRGMRPGLERTLALLARLGNPQLGLRGVLVTGTNGKGSVCATVDSVARAAGLRTILLTKPHLISYCERILLDGIPITDNAFAAVIDEVGAAASRLPERLQPTGFEMLTVAGILSARRGAAQLVVCEVGMGGRLDSTNVLDLGTAAITNVAIDHAQHLGNTVSAIAAEKAAIIKAGNVAVAAADDEAQAVVARRCHSVGAELIDSRQRLFAWRNLGIDGVEVTTSFAGERTTLRTPLLGGFQAQNLATAIAICDALRAQGYAVNIDAVRDGVSRVRWPARMQLIASDPPVLIDAAHNPAAMRAMVTAVRALKTGRPVVALFAAMRDKDVRGMVRELMSLPSVLPVTTEPEVPRACSAAELASFFTPVARSEPRVPDALRVARDLAGPNGLVLVCGSVYLAGEALHSLETERS